MLPKFRKLLLKPKLYLSEITGVLLLGLGIYFIKSQGTELRNVGEYMKSGNSSWIAVGIFITIVYIFLQAIMYLASFRAVGLRVSLWESTILFLKRNLISIFLPGGGITSLAFFTKDIQQETNEENKTRIHLASTIYGFTGILSIVVIAIPVLIYLAFIGESWENANDAAVILIFFVLLVVYMVFSFIKRGWVHRLVHRFLPQVNTEFRNNAHFKFQFFMVNIYAVLIDLAGIVHLYVAMRVMGAEASWKIALIGYVIATLLLLISPFLRGIGAIEFSLTLVLKHYGFSLSEALAITLIYRLFEFWIPIAAGIVSFLLRKGNMLLRVAPALLLFALGIINIISVLTPALRYRVRLLRHFIPVETIHMSNYLVFILGLLSIITSAFLFRGLKNAWRFAILLCVLSLIGNLTKAIDYEEALVAFFTLLVLWFTRAQYYIKHNKQLQRFGIETSLIIFASVIIYGIIGFYFLDKRHFGIDFSLMNSIKQTFLNFILLDVDSLQPRTRFGTVFLNTIQISGIVSLGLIFYALIKPAYYRVEESSLQLFNEIGKKSLIIGQEAITDLHTFTLEGRDKKSMRNGLKNIENKGLKSVIYEAPIKDGVLQKLKYVSNEWLKITHREEIVFTQGMFDWDKLKQQTIITIENKDEQIFGFLNIIPDYAPDEVTYDLIRKTADAPGGVNDALIIALIAYCKDKNIRYLNLGLAPLSGIEEANGLPEKTLKFAYEKLQQFRHYRGLRDFKEKFTPRWSNKYLIYENHYDLISLPKALNKVMKP